MNFWADERLSWIKPDDQKTRDDPDGFNDECNALGPVYIPPAGDTAAADWLRSANAWE